MILAFSVPLESLQLSHFRDRPDMIMITEILKCALQ